MTVSVYTVMRLPRWAREPSPAVFANEWLRTSAMRMFSRYGEPKIVRRLTTLTVN